jgi:ABC-type multidrug transport system fused ATPase/permease subunit
MPAVPNKKAINYANAWAEARELVWAHRGRLSIGLVLILISQLAGLVMPWSSKFLVDRIVVGKRPELLPWLALGVGSAALVQAFSSFALSQILGVAAQAAITDMRKRVMEHVTRLPVRYFDSTQTGILIARVMSDAEGVRNLVGTGLAQLVGGVITGVVALTVLFYLNWRLTSLTLIVLAVFAAVMTLAFTRLRPLFRERSKINAEVTGRLTESISGIRIVKAYTAERREELTFARGVHRLLRNVAQALTGMSAVAAISTLVLGAVAVIMILEGGRSILIGKMTLGDFFMYAAFTGAMVAPLVQIASIGTQITDAFAGLDRIRELRSQPTEIEGDEARVPVRELRGEVVFEDVSFEYVPGQLVLQHVSFRASAGTTTALVGSSGSGKSTMIGLVMAFHRPLSGVVRVDGRDLAGIRLIDYRRNLGAVFQDNFLFDGTVADNIAFSRPHARREEIREAARIAHCDEFVNGFPQGYDTVVGERGVRLSGGQRQRVAIARAILANPKILILDEATSSLDSESEAMIQDGLRALRRGRTTFVIAHRLSTIVTADQILVMEGGQIVERGTHPELLERGGRYRQLYDRQYKIELDRFINPGEDFTPDLPKAVVQREPSGATRAD